MRKEKTAPLPKRALPDAPALCRQNFPDSGAALSPGGKAAFARFLSAEPLERATGSRLIRFLGHWTKGRLTGVGSLREKSHLCLLFVEKESREKDIGGTLLKETAYFARKRAQPL